MQDQRLQEEIDSAAAYEALHVPALFREWTPRVLESAQVRSGHRVLDVACGTGVLSRAAAGRVGAGGAVIGVDPNPGMLTVASRLSGDIRWVEGVAEDLPCEDASFDRVVSQFGMMFFNDRGAAVREMLRVLVPEGRLAIAVWDSLENTPAYARAVHLLDRMAGPEAANALRAPFVMGDRAELEELVHLAGADDVEGKTPLGRARFPSLRAMLEADLRGWLPVMGVILEEEMILAILSRAEQELGEYVTPEGRAEFDSPAHIVSGRKPG